MKTWEKLKHDPRLWGRYALREQVLREIRMFFYKKNYHEVETPILIGHPPAESYLDVFETTLLDRRKNPKNMYLSTSPEVALKKCMVAGIGNCFSLTKSFRNTEVGDRLHNPEFTLLEWYRVGATYIDIMKECEVLILDVLERVIPAVKASKTIQYGKEKINLTSPWKRLSVQEAFQVFANVDLNEFFDIRKARVIAKKKGYTVADANTWEELFNQVFLNEVEPHIEKNRPVFLYDFPKAVGALAKTKTDDPRFVERFELYIGGLELADCYTELTDWKEQKERFEKELLEIKRLGKTPYSYDEDFIEALKAGLPASSGIAMGIDRLLMLLTNTNNVADTLLFPIDELV